MSLTESFKWNTNRVLAIIALVLGLGAVAGDPYGGSKVSLDLDELAWIVEAEVDHVTVDDLADRIIQGNMDYRLIDIRSDSAFGTYHLPSAENVQLSGLLSYPLQRNEQIILYSDGGIHSAQAWFLLQANGYKSTYMLLGGLDAWKSEVLFPTLPEKPTPVELAKVEKRRYVSDFFGGTPVHGDADSTQQSIAALPKLDTSERPVIVLPGKKKRKEGC